MLIRCRECNEPVRLEWHLYCDRCYRALKFGVQELGISGSLYLERRCVCGGRLRLLTGGWCRCESCGCIERWSLSRPLP